MQAIRHVTKYAISYAVMILALVVYFGYSWLVPAQLEFVELQSPAGFRALVLGGQSSRADPVTAALLQSYTLRSETDASGICKALYRDEASPVIGDPDSPVSIVEFFDYRCPYCKKLVAILEPLKADGRVNVIYKEWPVLGKSSQLAARAALAAAKQGSYLAFHTNLMNSGFLPSIGYIEELVNKQSLNRSQFSDDMASDRTSAALLRNAALAKQLGLLGTPALIVGRTIVQGAVTRKQLERLVELEKSNRPAC